MAILRILRTVAFFRGTCGARVLIEEEKEPGSEADSEPSLDSSTRVGEVDQQSKGDVLKSLGSQFNDPCLKSSTRVLIIFSLALNKKLGFGELLSLTGTGKGSLSNHLEKLESSGYIRTRTMMTFGGSRIIAEITEKGLQSFNDLLTSLKKLGK